MKITLKDFPSNLVDLSPHQDEQVLSNHIYKAIRFDLSDVLPISLWLDLISVSGTDAEKWNEIEDYLSGNYVIVEESIIENKCYKALADNTNSRPSAENYNWQEIPLLSFYFTYVKPFVVLSAYVRLVSTGGVEMTHTGPRQYNEQHSELTDKKQLDAFLKDYIKTQARFKLEMLNAFADMDYKIGEKTYKTKEDPTLPESENSIGINAI